VSTRGTCSAGPGSLRSPGLRNRLSVAIALALVAGVVTRPAPADPLGAADRALLRRRLAAVPRTDARFANARLLLGAIDLGDERPLSAARALEEALAAGVTPRGAALSLLLWSWARAGDRPRALGTLARWPDAPRSLVRRVGGSWAKAGGSLAAGHDTNVRLDTDASGPGGAGVGATWVAASADVTLRPLRRRERLSLQVALDQRVHVTERAAARVYDVGRSTLSVIWDEGFAREALRARVDSWGQETFGAALGVHLEHAAGLDLRLGAHPPGSYEVGLWLGGAGRDLDGAALGDRTLDGQDGVRIVAGIHAEAALPMASTSVALRAGYHQEMSRRRDWDAQGIETHAVVGLQPGRLGLALDGGWLYRRFPDAMPVRDEHRLTVGLEAGVALGAVTPFLRASGEWNVTDAPQAFHRLIMAGGVAANWEAP
jgi:hypothetical protein